MSIWASMSDVGEHQFSGCTDGSVLKYEGSHVYPKRQGEHGTVGLAVIPGHVRGDGQDRKAAPFLRLTLTQADPDWGGSQMATASDAVLTKVGVRRLRRQLRVALLAMRDVD